ncbi:MAG: LysM peptidoglycan-binding domain-containing protein [Chloroflexi bacterium]|nr:LysM peptidoglycan-binding domain-containing protein [Chloroflexota bacterium]
MVVITVTPGADGLQVHVVQPGETLITIAAAYRVNLADLLVLNGIAASAVIFPGDQLKIPREGASATTEAVERDQTPSATPTAGRTSWVLFPTWTPRPSRTPQPVEMTVTPFAPTATPAQAGPGLPLSFFEERRGDRLLSLIGVLVVVGVGFLALGSVMKRRG